MALLQLCILGVVIGSNNLAASLALGALGQAGRWRRVAVTFGSFEFLVPLVGILLGRLLSVRLVHWAQWFSAALLVGVGVATVVTAVRQQLRDEQFGQKLATWGGVIALGAGLSVDNLVIGFSLGLRRFDPLTLAITIAVFSVAFSMVGLRLGDVSRRHWERPAELVSGGLLIVLGVVQAAGWL
ncbi:MAG: manganese efflux pump MntP family protein [Phycisphaerae bacterium]